MRKFIFVLALLLASTVSAQTRQQGGTQVGPVGGGGSFNPTITTPASGQVLYYNGSGWVNSASPTLTSLTLSGSTAELALNASTTLDNATGNEIAYRLAYTTNKATSGNDTGLLISMTDTASPGTSLLFDAQVGGASKFSIEAATGHVTGAGKVDVAGLISTGTNLFIYNNAGSLRFGTSEDVLLFREAAAHLGLRNATTAQKLSVSGTYTDDANYRRAFMTAATGATTTATFGCETAGTAGANCDVVISPAGTGSINLGSAVSVDQYGQILSTGSHAIISNGSNSVLLGAGSTKLAISSSAITVTDAINFVFNTTTGTKIGTATNQKQAWWNATPVVQPSSTGESSGFVAGAGTTVTHLSTFTGNLGSTAYTLADVVKHLKTIGLLAQ